jgi:hypothetical protein
MKYKLFNSGFQQFIINIESNSYIPLDPNNQDFVEYQKWLDAGNTPIPAEEQA